MKFALGLILITGTIVSALAAPSTEDYSVSSGSPPKSPPKGLEEALQKLLATIVNFLRYTLTTTCPNLLRLFIRLLRTLDCIYEIADLDPCEPVYDCEEGIGNSTYEGADWKNRVAAEYLLILVEQITLTLHHILGSAPLIACGVYRDFFGQTEEEQIEAICTTPKKEIWREIAECKKGGGIRSKYADPVIKAKYQRGQSKKGGGKD